MPYSLVEIFCFHHNGTLSIGLRSVTLLNANLFTSNYKQMFYILLCQYKISHFLTT